MSENYAVASTSPPKPLPSSISRGYAQTMTRTVTIKDAQANLSSIASEVIAGNEIIIAEDGKPLMKLVAISPVPPENLKVKRELGFAKDLFKDFDWDEWDRLEEEMHQIWRKFGYME